MLEPEMADLVQAPPGTLLVERDDLQKSYAGILILSPEYKKFTLGATATVLSVGRGVGGWQKGDRVLLAASAGFPIEFGWNGARTLWRIYPGQVMADLDPETPAKHLGSHPARSLTEEQLAGDVRQGRDEGDAEGLR